MIGYAPQDAAKICGGEEGGEKGERGDTQASEELFHLTQADCKDPQNDRVGGYEP